MCKAKKLYVLLGVLLVACVATLAVSRHEEEKEIIQNSDEIILTVDAEKVTALSWEYGETSLAFHKDEVWQYDEDEAFPVDEEKISGLLKEFQEFGVSFVIDEVEDYAQYGLDEPTCTIQIAAGDTEYTIELGAYSTMDSKRYVSIGDGKVYLVNQDPMEAYELEIKDLIKHDEIPDLGDATLIRFTGEESYEIAYEEESNHTYCADDVYFIEDKPLDSNLVSTYLSAAEGLGLTKYVSYNVTEEELAAYGLDTPEMTISVDYPVTNEEDVTTTETFVLHIGRNQEDSNETAYARVGESQIVYEITSSNYESLTANTYDDLRHKEVLTASFDDVYQIDVTLGDEEYTFKKTDVEGTTTWTYAEESVSISSIKSAVQALEATTFTQEEPTKKLEIAMTVHLENENYPTVTVELYRYNGSECIATVDGEVLGMVSRSKVVNCMEAVYAIVLN